MSKTSIKEPGLLDLGGTLEINRVTHIPLAASLERRAPHAQFAKNSNMTGSLRSQLTMNS